MNDPLGLFLELLKAALFSFSGSGNLPILHQSLIERGWATDQQFARALAIGQLSPGPTGLWVICLGFLIDSWRGAALALLATVIPPLLVLLVLVLYRRIGHMAATQGFVRGLTLAVVGISITVIYNLWQSNGVDLASTTILFASVALGVWGKVPVPLIFVLAGVAGALIWG